ncbi:Ras GTPase-activating protein 1 [Entophlyctis sp. JEL0112]|nr:Ras GTPase-activating protein 1 [Entophlyctis sp. JEL0112]
MADGAGISRYMTESLRISKALQAFLAARHASEVQYATALAEACYTLRENVESKVETEGRLQTSPLKQAVADLVKGTGKIADARYGFAGMMKKKVLDVFAAVNFDLQVFLESQQEAVVHMQDNLIEKVEILRKDKATYAANKEALNEVKDLVAKMQEDSPQKKKELDRLNLKLKELVQKMVQLNCAVQESQDKYDDARNDYIKNKLPRFQKDLIHWTETRANSIKDMLVQLKQLEQIALEKAEEAINVGKDSANAIDTQKSVSQFMDTVVSLDLEARKASALSIRDMQIVSKAGKLYVKRSKSPLSPWCIQYSLLKENRLILFDGPESEHPREVILLDKIPKVIPVSTTPQMPPKSEKDFFEHTIVNEVQHSLFQKPNCFQLMFHCNASIIPISLEAKADALDSRSLLEFQENSSALEISRGPRSTGADRRYYFIPVDQEPAKLWMKAFVENGSRSCHCGNCPFENNAKLGLRIWVIEGTSIGVERGSNDNLSVMIKFGKLKKARTSFKQGPNPVWNEEFRFELKNISFSVNSSLNLDNGDSDIGNICFRIEEMNLERRVETTVHLSCSGSDDDQSIPAAIKIAYILTIHEQLELESYKDLIESLTTPPLNSFYLFSDVLPHDDKDEFCDNYLNLLLATPSTLLPALSCLMDREISETEDPNILFRGNSTLTKILDRFMRMRGAEYVKIVLSDCIKEIYENESTLEIDPNKITARDGEDASKPKRFGLIAHDPDIASVRKLTLITKIMQHLANFSPFGVKERHMECSNEWITSNTDSMKTFLDKISTSDSNFDLSSTLEVNAPDQMITITCMHRFLSGCAQSIMSTTPAILSNATWQHNILIINLLDFELEAKARKSLEALRATIVESKHIIPTSPRNAFQQERKEIGDSVDTKTAKENTNSFNSSPSSASNRRKDKTKSLEPKYTQMRRESKSLESFVPVNRPSSLHTIQALINTQKNDALMNQKSRVAEFEVGESSTDGESKNVVSSPEQQRHRMSSFINRFKIGPEQNSPSGKQVTKEIAESNEERQFAFLTLKKYTGGTPPNLDPCPIFQLGGKKFSDAHKWLAGSSLDYSTSATSNMPRTLLARYEQNPLLRDQECICYATFFDGQPPISFIRDRVEQILRLNPPLQGRLSTSIRGLSLDIPDSPLTPRISDHFTVQRTTLTAQTRPLGKAMPRLVGRNKDCAKNRTPLFVVAVLLNPSINQFCVAVAVSHLIADGVTFYNLLSMLGSKTEPFQLTFNLSDDNTNGLEAATIKARSCLRKTMFSQLIPTFDHPVQFAVSLLRHRFSGARAMKKSKTVWRWNHYEIPSTWIEAQKRIAMSNAPASVDDRPQFVSTNDIVVSWFCKKTNADCAGIYLNIRGKVPFLTKNHAGNYMRPLMFQRGDYESPWKVRDAISRDAENICPKFRAPGVNAKFSVVSNVCGLFQKIELPGCQFVEHHYTLQDDLIGAGVPYCTVYTTAPGKVCVLTNVQVDPKEFD